jgi:hypothetical protein
VIVAVTLAALAGCQRAEDKAAEEIIERAAKARGRDAKVTIDREHSALTIELDDRSPRKRESKTP